MIYASATIDLSRTPAPDAIEALSFEDLRLAFLQRFQTEWDGERAIDPNLPAWDVGSLEANPVARVGARAWSYLRTLDRGRVNDAIKAVLAPLATGADLDNVVARVNVERLVIREATATAPAIVEGDASLLRRYLLAFDRPSAGSRDRYLYEAWTAWPEMGDASVVGRAVHGRAGESDVVVTGPGGRVPTEGELATVRAAVTAPHVKPEALGVSALAATRREYQADLVVTVPASGPDAEIVRLEAVARVRAAGDGRTVIGGEVPADLLSGAAYGANVIKVRDRAPVVIEPDSYTVPVLTEITVDVEVRA
ncbi:baseplate assembly protein [Aurantimonas phage AmM-1]|uniref:baseplate assembly protein n=1 Tax=Aurantimonas phage AmM-1 TaxID=1503929 RepID=UPI00054091D4|nr:baseplate assembly protein [Aurantimonas phage AmM-1]BAP94472.1 baseplate assembly protein [Aurantimonas phage AmM-1]